MAQNNAADDPRPDSLKVEMAAMFEDMEAEYRTEDHWSVVYEGDELVIVADHTGHELREWANTSNAGDVTREELRSFFRAVADDKMGEKEAHEVFSYSDPVVYDKTDA